MFLSLIGAPAELTDTAKTAYYALKNHGRYTNIVTEERLIINIADMTVDSKGNVVSCAERLDDIRSRYGKDSEQYLKACDICRQIGLK